MTFDRVKGGPQPAPSTAPPGNWFSLPVRDNVAPSGPRALGTQRASAPRALPARTQRFGRWLLDQGDPLEAAGVAFMGIGISNAYPVDRSEQGDLTDELFERVHDRVAAGQVPSTSQAVVDYQDASTEPREGPRRYLVVEQETVRRSNLRVYTTFQTYGDNLYIGMRAYILPPLRWLRFLAHLLAATAVVMSLYRFTGEPGLVVAVVPVLVMFNRTIKSLRQGETLGAALRRQFPRLRQASTFDQDDILKFFKSTIPLILHAVQDVFDERDIPVDVLLRAIEAVYNVTTINTQGGAFVAVGSVIGSVGSAAEGRAG